MDIGIYKSIELWKEIEVKKRFFGKARIRVKKLNIGESLNYLVNSRAYRLKHDRSAIQEIFSYSITTKGITIYECDYGRVLDAIEEITFEKSDEKQKYNDKWLTNLISFFGYFCGWSKEDVFKMYMCEVPEIIEQIIDTNNSLLDTQRYNSFIASVCGFSSKPTESYKKFEKEINECREKMKSGKNISNKWTKEQVEKAMKYNSEVMNAVNR